MNKRIKFLLIYFVINFFLLGCSSPLSYFNDNEFEINVVTDSVLNSWEGTNSNSLSFKVYYLSNIDNLANLNYFDFISNDKKVLKSSLVKYEQFFVNPNDNIQIKGLRDAKTNYLLIVFFFIKPDLKGKKWYLVNNFDEEGSVININVKSNDFVRVRDN